MLLIRYVCEVRVSSSQGKAENPELFVPLKYSDFSDRAITTTVCYRQLLPWLTLIRSVISLFSSSSMIASKWLSTLWYIYIKEYKKIKRSDPTWCSWRMMQRKKYWKIKDKIIWKITHLHRTAWVLLEMWQRERKIDHLPSADN